MLVLTRKVGEKLHFNLEDGRRIELEIVRDGRNIRLGITAPRTIGITRPDAISERFVTPSIPQK